MKSRNMAVMALTLMAIVLVAIGCGSSGPTSAVDDYMQAIKNQDCNKMIDGMDLKTLEDAGMGSVKDSFIQTCEEQKNQGPQLVSYKILEENTDGDKATVKVEATISTDGNESTETSTMSLVQRDGKWLVSAM